MALSAPVKTPLARPGIFATCIAFQLTQVVAIGVNVRELVNAIEHGIICSVDKTVQADSLPKHIHEYCSRAFGASSRNLDGETDFQRDEIMGALTKTGGNKSAAASMLGIDRSTLWRRMRSLGIQ